MALVQHLDSQLLELPTQQQRKEVLYFYLMIYSTHLLWLYDIEHMDKHHLESEREYLILSLYGATQIGLTMAFVIPVVEGRKCFI